METWEKRYNLKGTNPESQLSDWKKFFFLGGGEGKEERKQKPNKQK